MVTRSSAINTLSSGESDPEKQECRLCQDDERAKDLIVPCNCSGSIKYIHRDCLQKWLNYSLRTGKGTNESTSCTVCGEPYRIIVSRPSVWQYLEHKTSNLNAGKIIQLLQQVFNHLCESCSHVLLCWLLKILALYALVYVSIFTIRFELWHLSNGVSWDELKESVNGTMNNLVITTLGVLFHASMIYSGIIIVKIMSNSRRAHFVRMARSELRLILAMTVAAIISFVVPGYIARSIMWGVLGIDWDSYLIDLGTGRNFASHFLLSTGCLLMSSISIIVTRVTHRDFTSYRKARSVVLPCY